MCLSPWAYYIQIKGEFTDRRQAPAPISNQTGPSGEPCGAHICGHSLAAWHHGVLQESSTRIMGSCEPECSIFERTVGDDFCRLGDEFMSKMARRGFYHVPATAGVQVRRRGEEGASALVCCHLPFWRLALFKAFPSFCSKAFSESLFVTLLTSFPLPLSGNTVWVLYHVSVLCNAYVHVCLHGNALWGAHVCTEPGPGVELVIFSPSKGDKLCNVHPPPDQDI